MKRNTLVRVGVLCALSSTTLVWAADSKSGASSVDTIIVTAEKRTERLQDVPIVVNTMSEHLLEETGTRDIKDLALLTPGLTVTSTISEGSTTARIRGIGTVGDNPGLESSVGVVIDGVYRPRNGVAFGDLGDLERIEVLKGPQGTVFGKNTSAGVINIITKRPSFNFSSDAEVTAGNYGELGGSASINGPIASDKLAGRLYVAKRSRDGFIDIVDETGTRASEDDMDRDYYTTRGQLLWQATDALSFNLSADYSKRDENCCAAVQIINTPVPQVTNALSAIVPNSYENPADPYARKAHMNRDTTQEVVDKGLALDADWDLSALGGAKLTSISALRRWDMNNGQDSDYTNVDIIYRDDNGQFGSTFEQKSEELRLAGTAGRLDWLVGAFYAKEDVEYRNQILLGNDFQQYFGRLLGNPNAITLLTGNPRAFPGGQGQADVFNQDSSSWALFSNDTLHVTDDLHVTLGARYTQESKDLDSHYHNDNNGVGCQALRTNAALIQSALAAQLAALPAAQRAAAVTQALQTVYGIGCAGFADPLFNELATTQSIDEGEWSGTVKLAYDFNDHLMSYVSYARGYKASGFNMDRERDNTIVHESATVPLNLSNNPLNPAGRIFVNTDTSFDRELVDSYELGTKSQWLDNTLALNAAVFYQDYEDFQLNTFTGLQFVVTSVPKVISKGVDVDVFWNAPIPSLSVQGGVTYADTTIEDFGDAARFFRPEREGDTLSFAPKWSASLAALFEHHLGSSFLCSASVGAKYNSKYNTGSNLDPRKEQDAFTLINARLGFGAANRSWIVEAWVQNLTNKDYVQVAFDGTLQGSSATPAGTPPTSTIDGYLGLPRTYGVTAKVRF